ncbi:MAG: hypothetical protein HY323_08185 [Betaproteobacteria bacterium]|nr:hypothetical protein [Betaproteobacteria bacterium]
MSPLARVSPDRRKKRARLSAKKRLAPERYCVANRCYRAPVHIGRCGTHAVEHLDRMLRARIVASDTECELAAWHRHLFPCGGPIQVNHLVRREYRHVRWSLDNVRAGCRDMNLWADRHPLEWDAMIADWYGANVLESLKRQALSSDPIDYDAALRGLA